MRSFVQWNSGLLSLVAAMVLIFGGLPSVLAANAPSTAAKSYRAIVQPWRDVNLSFSRPGRVRRIAVHRGELVKAGQLLVRESNAAQLLALELAKLKANSILRVQAAQAELAQDQVTLKRTQWAASRNAATSFEVHRAELRVTIDRLSLKLALLKHQHDLLALSAAKLSVARRDLTAPFAGLIEARFVDVGKSVNAFKKVLRLVQIDHLRVFVSVPVNAALRLRSGWSAVVTSADVHPQTGKIIWIASVADPASNTLMVEIRINNKAGLPAGRQVNVQFLQPPAIAISQSNAPPHRPPGKPSAGGKLP